MTAELKAKVYNLVLISERPEETTERIAELVDEAFAEALLTVDHLGGILAAFDLEIAPKRGVDKHG